MSADGATVAAARALGGGRGALSDSSVVPLARGVAPSGPSLPSQALCGAAARPRRTKNTLQFNASTVRPRFTRESAVRRTQRSQSLSLVSRVCAWGALSSARAASAAGAVRAVWSSMCVTLSTRLLGRAIPCCRASVTFYMPNR